MGWVGWVLKRTTIQGGSVTGLSSGKLWQYCGLILSEPGEVFPKSYSSSIQLLAAAIGWLRPQTGHEVAEATVPPEVKGAMTALQRCAKGSTPLAPEMRQVAEELLEETSGKGCPGHFQW
ncbi:unnamed protein product [Cladocopium goreaui]|uniref:Uncharacterized protein n=1 Tax=Cladocopium goreaui TaxID=2562237 RepID=A0A9P1DNV7_9DINO|nr:unnamed protein product [Cladocopium goreaui]CAI4013655.1 unnamed protein product [Cladocopium goreaui]